MSDNARSLTVWEFLHCYHPDEINKSKGMYSFVPRKSVLKVIYETPDSNRDWKSRYFFLEGDGWMCHLREMDYMLVDKTWGILDLSGIYIFVALCMCFIIFNTFMTVLIAPSLCFLQYDGIPKLTSRSTTSLKNFLLSLNQRNGLGLSSSTSIPSTGIVTDLNPIRQLLSTRSAPISVSPSTSTFN